MDTVRAESVGDLECYLKPKLRFCFSSRSGLSAWPVLV